MYLCSGVEVVSCGRLGLVSVLSDDVDFHSSQSCTHQRMIKQQRDLLWQISRDEGVKLVEVQNGEEWVDKLDESADDIGFQSRRREGETALCGEILTVFRPEIL